MIKKIKMPHQRFHQWVFALAGTYNILWGLYSAWDPQWLFRFAGMPPMNHPEIFACLAMVVGLYGILYWDVARRPTQGGLVAAVGLLGKLLGPIGAFVLIHNGDWPLKALVLCVGNDFIWWLPFAFYLMDCFKQRIK